MKHARYSDPAFDYDRNDAGYTRVRAHPKARPVKVSNIHTATSKKSIVHHQ